MRSRWRMLGKGLLWSVVAGCYPLLDSGDLADKQAEIDDAKWDVARDGPIGGLGELQFAIAVGDWPGDPPGPVGRAIFARIEAEDDVHAFQFFAPVLGGCHHLWDYEFPIEIRDGGPDEVRLTAGRTLALPKSANEPGLYHVVSYVEDPGNGPIALQSEENDNWAALDLEVAGVVPQLFDVVEPDLASDDTWSVGLSFVVRVSDDVDTKGAYFHTVVAHHVRAGESIDYISCAFTENEIEVPQIWDQDIDWEEQDFIVLEVSRAYYGRDRLPGDEALEFVGRRTVVGRVFLAN